MPGGKNLKVDVDNVRNLGTHAKDLANHVSGLPDRHPLVKTSPEFGNTAGGDDFAAARTMLDAYVNQVEKFVGPGSNLTDLVDQFTLMNTGTNKIVTDYNAGVLTEANAADEFQRAMGGSSTTGA